MKVKILKARLDESSTTFRIGTSDLANLVSQVQPSGHAQFLGTLQGMKYMFTDDRKEQLAKLFEESMKIMESDPTEIGIYTPDKIGFKRTTLPEEGE